MRTANKRAQQRLQHVLLAFKARYYVLVAFIGDEHEDEQDDEYEDQNEDSKQHHSLNEPLQPATYETQNDTEESKPIHLTEIQGERKGAEDKQSVKEQDMKKRSEEEETVAENHASREAPTVGIAKE